VAATTPRRWWLAIEPIHSVVYFDPDCLGALAGLGLEGFWSGYVAGRAAPLGPVGPDLVTAVFATFARRLVAGALPDAWDHTTPDEVWATRRTAAAATLRRVDGGVDAWAARAVGLLRPAVASGPASGRPLFAATRAMGWPDDPVEALWFACTCLREHRGDGHVAALGASGLDGVEALVLFGAGEGLPRELFLRARGWTAAEWADAVDRLVGRGLLDGTTLSTAGLELRRSVEAMTDEQAGVAWAVLDGDDAATLLADLGRLGAAIRAAGVIRYPNAMGLPEPDGA